MPCGRRRTPLERILCCRVLPSIYAVLKSRHALWTFLGGSQIGDKTRTHPYRTLKKRRVNPTQHAHLCFSSKSVLHEQTFHVLAENCRLFRTPSLSSSLRTATVHTRTQRMHIHDHNYLILIGKVCHNSERILGRWGAYVPCLSLEHVVG